MLKRYLISFIKVCIGLTFVVPLIVLSESYIFPFIVPKIVLLRSIIIAMVVCYVSLLIVSWKEYAPRLTMIHGAVMLFFFSFFISTFFGTDWYKSFWDNHERMLGLFTITHYILFYIVVSQVITEWKDIRYIARCVLALGGIVMIIGMWQRFVDPEALLNRGSGRVASTLGNAIYYSGYGMFLFFFGLLIAYKEQIKEWKWFAYSIAALGALGIFLGGTRGTVFGLIGGLGILALYYMIGLREHARVRQSIAVGLVGCIIVAAILISFRSTSFVQNIPAVGRLVNTSFTETTASTRIMAWQIAFDAWKEHPLVGWGPNNYFYAFNKFYRPEFLQYGFQETWFDNAHSALFNTFAVQGTLGGVSYILIFLLPSIALFWAYRHKRIDVHVAAISTAFLAGHFIHNAFVFENPTSYLYFFFFIALVHVCTKDTSCVKDTTDRSMLSWPVFGVIGVIGLCIVYATNINPARANMRALDAIRASYELNPLVVSIYQDAIAIPSPHIDDIRSDFARSFVERLPDYARANRIQDLETLYPIVDADLQKNLALHPFDIRTHILFSRLLQYGAALQQDEIQLQKADSIINDARALSPKRQQLAYLAIPLKQALKKNDEIIEWLEQSIQDAPMIGHSWWRLAALYYDMGDVSRAKETLEKAAQQGVVFDSESAPIVEELKKKIESVQ